MITALAIFAVIGVGLGLWGECAEQRRLGRMARDCKKKMGRETPPEVPQ